MFQAVWRECWELSFLEDQQVFLNHWSTSLFVHGWASLFLFYVNLTPPKVTCKENFNWENASISIVFLFFFTDCCWRPSPRSVVPLWSGGPGCCKQAGSASHKQQDPASRFLSPFLEVSDNTRLFFQVASGSCLFFFLSLLDTKSKHSQYSMAKVH